MAKQRARDSRTNLANASHLCICSEFNNIYYYPSIQRTEYETFEPKKQSLDNILDLTSERIQTFINVLVTMLKQNDFSIHALVQYVAVDKSLVVVAPTVMLHHNFQTKTLTWTVA